jgi:hypothetical protein
MSEASDKQVVKEEAAAEKAYQSDMKNKTDTPVTKKPEFVSTRPPVMVDLKDPTKGMKAAEPADMTGYGSPVYKHKALPDDAPLFGLKVEEGDYGHTHHLRSAEHSWSGTEQEFKDAFEKK